jgi:hypothetical protein
MSDYIDEAQGYICGIVGSIEDIKGLYITRGYIQKIRLLYIKGTM